jgi:hypothetical protein
MPGPLSMPSLARRQVCSTSYALGGAPQQQRAPRAAASPSSAPRRAVVAVVPHSSASKNEVHPDPSAPLYPGFQEEKDVSHEAFMHAFEAARPRAMRLPGMQEFAASIWERRRRIPSQTYSDPLDHIFTEFDADGDGKLSAAEIAAALSARGVEATEEQVQMFIEGARGFGVGWGGCLEVVSCIHEASSNPPTQPSPTHPPLHSL